MCLAAGNELNMELEKANRVADFIELGELMVDDALNRSNLGGHFREESQVDGEALRKDDEFFMYPFLGIQRRERARSVT